MSDDFEETGDANSEPADAPGTIPADTDAAPAAERVAEAVKPALPSTFESAPPPGSKRNQQNARLRESRKAFAEAILANKSASAPAHAAAPVDEFDPEAAPAPEAAKPAAVAPPAPAVAAKPVAPPSPAPVVPSPPAPSLDPDVRRLREEAKRDREAAAAALAEAKKPPPAPVVEAAPIVSYEDYVDRPSSAYRSWLETMRGEKFASDDEFKLEARDFIESLSSDTLGVPLPPETRNALEARLARKAVRASKTMSARREAEAAARAERERTEAATKAETERIEQEWSKASDIIGQQFAPQTGADGKPVQSQAAAAYQWLAAEDEPGKIVVDVIRAAYAKDGTNMSWQEASKHADEYLKSEYQSRYEKRRALLAPTPAVPIAAQPAVPPPAPPPAKPPAPRIPANVENTSKWDKAKHLEESKRKFAAARAAFDAANKT